MCLSVPQAVFTHVSEHGLASVWRPIQQQALDVWQALVHRLTAQGEDAKLCHGLAHLQQQQQHVCSHG